MLRRRRLATTSELLGFLWLGTLASGQEQATLIQPNIFGIRYGWSVAGAGDVDGDGYDDIVASAPLYENGESNEGIVYFHRGSASGVKRIPSWSVEGEQRYAGFGRVRGAGDVNGDGYDDILVGSEAYDHGQLVNNGRVFLFAGGPGGPDPTPTWARSPIQAGTKYGISLGSAGDVNGDGYDDVFVGAPDFTRNLSMQGKVFVYHGSPNGLSSVSWSILGRENEHVGSVVTSAGDVNGDGYDDLLVGEPDFRVPSGSYPGRALLYLGSSTGLSEAFDWKVVGNQNGAKFGGAVAGVGDVNGDGYDDLLVSAPYYDNPEVDEGRVYGFYGSPSGPSTTPDWIVEPDRANATFGSVLAEIGDFGRDGFADVMVDRLVFYGGSSGLGTVPDRTPTVSLPNYIGLPPGFGSAVAGAGDVNADGFADYVVGSDRWSSSPLELEEGAVWVYHGSSEASVWRRTGSPLLPGPNPLSYTANPPVLGAAWDASVDLTATGHDFAYVVAHAEPDLLTLPGGQVSLVGGVRVGALPWRPGPVATWSVPIPNDPALYSVRLFTQAAHVGGVRPFALSNSQDLRLGY